jgi:uncharacterized protein GlcG (DUF336 family)
LPKVLLDARQNPRQRFSCDDEQMQLASIEIALNKAVTANSVKRLTKALQDPVTPGSATPHMQRLPGITPVDGDLPIVINGTVGGAIGAAASQDAEVAAAGLAAATREVAAAYRAATSTGGRRTAAGPSPR